MDELNQQRLARRPLWRSHPQLFETVLEVLFCHDPIGITGHDKGATEYAPEVGTILPRLKEATSEDELRQIVQEEFVRWFGSTARRRVERYSLIASELWPLLQEPTLREQIPTVPDDVPNRAISLVVNLLDKYDDPDVHIRVAQVLLAYTDRIEDQARIMKARQANKQ